MRQQLRRPAPGFASAHTREVTPTDTDPCRSPRSPLWHAAGDSSARPATPWRPRLLHPPPLPSLCVSPLLVCLFLSLSQVNHHPSAAVGGPWRRAARSARSRNRGPRWVVEQRCMRERLCVDDERIHGHARKAATHRRQARGFDAAPLHSAQQTRCSGARKGARASNHLAAERLPHTASACSLQT